MPRPVFLADLSILSRRQIRSNLEICAIDIMDQSLAQNLSRLRIGDSGTPTMSARTDDEATQVQVSSGITPDTLRYRLIEKLDATHVQIEDMSGGCGQMFEAIIVSPQFAKKTTLARHRLVNNTLKEEIAAIHAWTPKCHTPEEWEKKKAQA
ncbi:bola protein [Cenococcum geophilum]